MEEIEEGMEDCDISDDLLADDLYCVACDKFFNSESAKLNHEASKKHKHNVELLKSEMNSEEEKYQQQASEVHDEVESEVDAEVEPTEEPAKKSKGKKSKKKNKKVLSYDDAENEAEEAVAAETPEVAPVVEEKIAHSEDEIDWTSNKKGKKLKTKLKPKNEKSKLSEPVGEPVKVEEVPKKIETSEEPIDDSETENRCATCCETFPSKNKLFNHLKKTNHSIYLGQEVKSKAGEKGSSRKKK